MIDNLIQTNKMNVTKIQQTNKQVGDTSKAPYVPHTYELKHYPHDGILERLAFMLIRPPRFIYNPDVLKPSKRIRQIFTAETYHIPFELTFYKQKSMHYVILYLHGNGSSRLEGTLFLPYLPQHVGLACFDFGGCGNRTQIDYITLGQEQWKDVDIAAAFLKKLGHLVVGWGRSMGAVSLLLSKQCNIVISDSAYSNLSLLCKQQSSKFLPKACCCIFNCLFPCVFACIQCKVRSLSGLEISNMDIAKKIESKHENRQICFLHGELDKLVPYHHAQKLYQSFNGAKQLILFEGTHNSFRSSSVLAQCFDFIDKALERGPEKPLNVSNTKLIEMDYIPTVPRLQSRDEKRQTNPMSETKKIQLKVLQAQPSIDDKQSSKQLKECQKIDEQYHEIGPNEQQLSKIIPQKDNRNETSISEQNYSSSKRKKSQIVLKEIKEQ